MKITSILFLQAGKEVKESVYIFVNGKILLYSFQKRYTVKKGEQFSRPPPGCH